MTKREQRHFTARGRPWVIETQQGAVWIYTCSLPTKEQAVLLLTRSTERVYNNETGETIYRQKGLPS